MTSGLEGFLEANRTVQATYLGRGTDVWMGSPFEWLLKLPSRSRGAAGEMLGAEWMKQLGYVVQPPANSGHDRRIAGRKVEIKFSTLWQQGEYVFQQFRDQDYELALLVGVSPAVVHLWLMPKIEAWNHAVPQHGGKAGSDTRWLRFRAADIPVWMNEYGGPIDDAVVTVVRTLGPPK